MHVKTVEIDFGAKRIPVEVPESAVVAEFREPEPLASPARALAAALADPCGAPPLAELAKPGMKIAIGFDDPTRPPQPWRAILPAVVEVLLGCGVSRDDIVLICANGNHKKWSDAELRAFVGEEMFTAFRPGGRIVNHDCLDASGLKYLGETPSGCVVEHNRRFVEADLMIYVGQVMAHTWGGYTGTGAVIGMASTRSILSHHNHGVVNHPRTATGDHRRMVFRKLKAEINAHIERVTGKRIFYVNWVGGSGGRMAGIFAGYSPEVEPPAWQAADRFSVVEVPQADVLVIGLPERFAYGSADNPLIAAIGVGYPPRVWLGDHVLRRGGVVIGVTPSTGEIDAGTYPSYQEVIDLYARHHEIHELARYQEAVASRPDYLECYAKGGAYHPIHPFWLLYACDYVLSRAGVVFMAGVRHPGAFRKLGLRPVKSFADAWARAEAIAGPDPVTVVAPTYWSRRIFKFKSPGSGAKRRSPRTGRPDRALRSPRRSSAAGVAH